MFELTFGQPIWFISLLGYMAIKLFFFWRRPKINYDNSFWYPLTEELSTVAVPVKPSGYLSNWLVNVAIVCFILAATEPRTLDYRTKLQADGISLAFVIDVSGSMAEPIQGFGKSRLEAAKEALGHFLLGGRSSGHQTLVSNLPGRPEDHVAVIVFAATPETISPLTLDHEATLQRLTVEQPRGGIDSGTNLGDALVEALLRLEVETSQRKVIVLLSDGEQNLAGDGVKGPIPPEQAAALAAALGVIIHTIDCGGVPLNPELAEQRDFGRQTLKLLAQRTGGVYQEVEKDSDFSEVLSTLDQLERQKSMSFFSRRYKEWTWNLGLLGASLLALGMLSKCLGRRISPQS